MIFVIDSDKIMAKCIARACGKETRIFDNIIEAMGALDAELPEMIFLEVMLTGPDGWSLLNELLSYEDTRKIPIVIVSELNLEGMDLGAYGVVKVLHKDTMRPEDIRKCVERSA